MRILIQEMLVQNKTAHIVKHFALFLTFGLISTVIVAPPEEISRLGLVLSLIFVPLFLLTNNHFIIKGDLMDGNLELLLTSFSAWQIVLTKFMATLLNGLIVFTLTLPIILLFFHSDLELTLIFSSCFVMMLFSSTALSILISSVQSYFQHNTNFLSITIMPMILPNIILSGMLLSNPANISLMFIMAGWNLMFIPVVLYLARYLIDNIYHI